MIVSPTRTRARPPVRIVHLGIGAFARAHLAWYTDQVDRHRQWGIAAFTGRSAEVADALSPQDGVYTVITRSADSDTAHLVESVTEVHDGADVPALIQLLENPAVVIVTVTITENGYRLNPDGTPNLVDPLVADDIARIIALQGENTLTTDDSLPRTALGRLLLALQRRQRGGTAPLAIVSCDNISDNGGFLRRGLTGLASAVDPSLPEWIADNVSFVSTSVDRITPRTTPTDHKSAAALTGLEDASPVVTEPFSDWVLSGVFPGSRPEWENAGALFVDEIGPWEHRKLWMLNGAHTLLALAGPARGHNTVADAIGDSELRALVEKLWDDAAMLLPTELNIADYRAALLTRFRNPRIEHRLSQIAVDSDTKIRLRVVPVAETLVASARSASGCASAIAAWIIALRQGSDIPTAIAELSPALAASPDFIAAVEVGVTALTSSQAGGSAHHLSPGHAIHTPIEENS